jgi:hypothetical protein
MFGNESEDFFSAFKFDLESARRLSVLRSNLSTAIPYNPGVLGFGGSC